jgi:pimeloyl-ACP methyl ester carboxylesterase
VATVDIGGRAVEYERRGSGSPVILSSPTWWPLDAWTLSGLPELSGAHDVVAFNHRGIGGSTETDDPYAVESMAGDVVALADALGLERFHLAGYAIGAAVAMCVAQRHPGRIRSLTLAAPSSGLPQSAPSPRDAVLRDIEARGFEAHVRDHVAESTHPSFVRDRPTAAAALSDALWLHQGTLENFLKHAQARRGYAALEFTAGITVPALVLVGAEDAAVRGTLSPVAAAQAIAAALPAARLTLLPGVGHMPFWEAPAVWNAVLPFLAEADRTQGAAQDVLRGP